MRHKGCTRRPSYAGDNVRPAVQSAGKYRKVTTAKVGTSARRYGGLSAAERVDERRRRLAESALELFGTQGYSATPIEQLCSAANVSTRSFYEDLGSREALLMLLVDRITTEAAARAAEALQRVADEPLATRVAAGFRAYLEVTCRDHRTAQVCYVEITGVSPEVEKFRYEWRANIAGVIVAEAERAVERGEAKRRDFTLFALAIIGAVNSLGQQLALADRAPGGPVTLDDICTEIEALVNAAVVG